AAYEEAKANCDRICENGTDEAIDELASIKSMMLLDLTPPFGQYARFEENNLPLLNQRFSIFKNDHPVNLCNPQSPIRPPYKFPVNYTPGAGTTVCANGYQNIYGGVTLTQSAAAAMLPEEFTDNFNDNYAQSLLYYHPEFPKLKLAESSLLNSYRFGSKLQHTETFNKAVTRNFINTSLTNEGAAADHLLQQDPFFILTGFNSSYYNTMRNAILTNFVQANSCPGSQNMGMWKVAQLSVYCWKEMRANSTQPIIGGCFTPSAAFTTCLAGLNNLPPNTNDGHCDADHDMVWKNFRGFYMTLRNKMVSEYLTANTTIDYSIFNTNNGLNYQERFIRLNITPPPGIEDLNNLLNNSPGGYSIIAAQEADSICMANTGNWMMRLRRCNQVENLAINNPAQWSADSAWLSTYLVKICAPGVDYMGHPFGASSLPDGKPAVEITRDPNNVLLSPVKLVRNFPALIEYYLKFRFGPNAIDAYCYPELIDYPKAYNVAPPTVNTPIVTAPEPCNCERINYFKTKWQNAGSIGTFSSYLQNYHGTTIAQSKLDELLAMCATGYTSTNPVNCNFLTTPLKLPAIFQCRGTANLDSSKTCINCADFKDIVLAFKAERGVNNVPIVNPQTDAEIALNKAFADFANYKTGFSKTWPEYVEFSLLCVNNTDLSCKTLHNYLQQFYATNPPQTGTACENAFVTFMNNATGLSYTFGQWMQEFIKACGAAPPVCEPVVTCTTLKSIINSYYTTYGFQIWRNANCQTLFTNFVNSSLQTNYNYDQIVNLYNYVCGSGCTLSPCSFPNPHLLTLLYNTYKVLFPTPPKSVTLCQQNFTDWFNQQLGFDQTIPYTWLQIVSLYQMYSIDCTPDLTQLCTPPYSCESLNYVIQKFYIAYPNADQLVNCIQLFKDFFNEYFGTSYTYQEIAEIYAAVCNTTLVVCQGSTGWDCKQLIAITQNYTCNIDVDACSCFTIYFNNLFGTSYTYAQIVEIYKNNCNYELNLCPTEPPVFTCEQIQNTLSKFRKLYPNGGNYGATCESFFAAFFNGEHGTNLTYAQIVDQYLVVCEYVLDICNNQCLSYNSFVNSYVARYNNIKIPLEARRQLFSFLFNEAYGYNNKLSAKSSATGNQPLFYSQIKQMLIGCLTMPATLESETLLITLNDPDVLKDFRTAYYLLHPSGVPANCQNDFTNWVNTIMATDLDYADIQGYYNTVLGQGSGDICGTAGTNGTGAGSATTSNLEGRFGAISLPPMLCGLNVEIFDDPKVDTSTCKDPWLLAISDATIKWELYIDSLRRNFDVAWYNKCTNAKYLESFTVSFQKAEYHYTLYYHDQAGQLVRTVPPQGVDDRRADAAFLADVKAKRLNVKNGGLESNNIRTPDHTLPTDYRYNTLGQVVEQKTPDGGTSKFWYDVLGRLAVSQNAQQALDGKYSYTIYDDLGRITEVGQKPQGTAMSQVISRDSLALKNWITSVVNREQITRTVYDVSYFNGNDLLKPELLYQRNLRNRVSYTQVFDNQPGTFIGTHRAATYYTYDIHGNVDTLLQDYGDNAFYANVMSGNNNRYKKIAYNYDLISGKVNMVTYQPGYYNPQTQTWVRRPDQFYHRYEYDPENKLTNVYTSHDSLVWERDARYLYYKHGPLARMELGQQVVQGVDYAYTIQGWMKGVNGTAVTPEAPETCSTGTAKDILDVYTRLQFGQPSIYTARQEVNFHPEFNHDPGDDYETIINASLQPCVPVITPTPYAGSDMGEDGSMIANGQKFIPRDVYGFGLNYYKENYQGNNVYDYEAVSGWLPFSNNMFSFNNTEGTTVAKPLFNGNIASMMVNIPKLGNPQLYGYEYDQLNRLVSMNAFTGFNNGNNNWNGGMPTASNNYKERVSYDANGNILSYLRNGSTEFGGNQTMDNLTYQYPKDAAGKILNNRLRYVHDNVGDGNYNEDIDSQTPLNQTQVLAERLPEQAGDNYRYDAIGNLVKDVKEGITNITWTVYGKIASITKNGKTITYTYDASGNRISKTVPNEAIPGTYDSTWYVRDATGNVMSVYEKRASLNNNQLTQSEVHLYGSSRLGIINVNRNVQGAAGGNLVNFNRGNKMYELSNHLGNVLATVSDRKLAVDDG
ncbi:MAG: RHS repeat protein, partial [Dinghuibacter sp.]|nr:RHS repeat protein [Dinghuibacter sp.]